MAITPQEDRSTSDLPPALDAAATGPVDRPANVPSRRQLKGRYNLAEALGHGSLGTTYRAFDQMLQRPVAVKLLSERYAHDSLFGQRFMAAAAAASRLINPGIVTVLATGLSEGRPFLVMELVEGESLRAALNARGPLPLDRALGIALQIADALAYAHDRGVVHGDLRPENILVTANGRVKIVDFGIVRAAVSTDVTLLGSVGRRAPYVPPEQLLGDPNDVRDDIYALAAVLYELLTGVPPMSAPEALRAVAETPPPATPVSQFRPDVPPHIENAVARAISPDPRERFGTVRELRHSLSRSADRASTRHDGPTKVLAARRGTVPPRPTDDSARSEVAPAVWRPEIARRPRRGSRGLGYHLAAMIPLVATAAIVIAAVMLLTGVIPRLFSGFQLVDAPALVDYDLAEANAMAAASGLEVRVGSSQVTDDQPKDVVLSQTPAPGTRLRRGSEIRVVVSAGMRPPNVIGKPLDEARAILVRAGWTLAGVEDRLDSGAPSGTVIGSRPGPDEGAADKREGITLLVSGGNVAFRRPTTLSSGASGPGEMVDGDPTTAGRLPGPIPAWVEIELAQPGPVSGVELVLSQDRAGVTIHEVWVWTTDNQFRGMHTFVGPTEDNRTLTVRFDQPVQNVRTVRIATTQADTAIGWREIRVFDR